MKITYRHDVSLTDDLEKNIRQVKENLLTKYQKNSDHTILEITSENIETIISHDKKSNKDRAT
jgi:hypothetical protein